MADLRFASYAQPAIARALDVADDGLGGPLGAAAFHPAVSVVHPDGVARELDRSPGFTIPGPGAVAGIDPGSLVRTDPPAGAGDVEPNYLASVELRPIELPWLFTPARASEGPRRLRPWVVLVVVEAGGTTVEPGRPLPQMDVAVRELPPLKESWAWAHVQAPAPGAAPPPGVPALDGQAVARLVCPRRLRERTRYRACLVPAFRGGRDAGLTGEPPDPATELAPAWAPGDDRVTLPVYFAWEFGTGEDGDFEQLVRRLGPAPEERIGTLGTRLVDVAEPWPGIRLQEDTATVPVPGALRAVGSAPEGTATAATTDDLARRLADVATADGASPPLYGGRHLVRSTVTAPPADWLGELNLTAAARIAAGLGAAYVRAHQEELMARAWEQAGAIREENRRRALAELAGEVGDAVHGKHVGTMTAGETVLLAAPASERTPTAESLTLGGEVAVSTVPDAAAWPAFARFTRRRSVRRATGVPASEVVESTATGETAAPSARPLLGRLGAAAGGAAAPVGEGHVQAIAVATLSAASAGESGAAARDVLLLGTLARAARANGLPAQAGQLDAHVASTGVAPQLLLSGQLTTLSATLATQLSTTAQLLVSVRTELLAPAAPPGVPALTEAGLQLDVPGLRARVGDALKPSAGIVARLRAGATVPGAMTAPDPLARVMLHPTFPAPMSLALVDFAPDWLVPGIAAVPAETCALLRPEARFVEAFMVGLTHELCGELRWREYPTDLRGSPFTRFWPRPEGEDDIPPIHTWTGALGTHLASGASKLAVLLVRGSVVRRFPDMLVAAVPALDARTAVLDPAQWQAPAFVVRIDEQTAAYAFRHPDPETLRLPPEQAPGLFFAFQEHTYRIRFGFDAPGTTAAAAPRTWDDLDWDDVPQDDRGFALAAAPLATPPDDATGAQWAHDAADLASIALQRPFRVLIHSHRLVGR